MPSILPGFEYDIFVSYRHKDNKYDGWVTEFVTNLKKELEATFKEDVSIYFDTNPHDGILETYQVDKSLEGKLKCLIFIPVISQTYCDPKSFAWQNEFCTFNKMAKDDQFGRDVKLSNGNVASRILPIRIHDLDFDDNTRLKNELGGVLRSIDFIYKSSGVNRPLRLNEEHPDENLNYTIYRDQINKVANAAKEIISRLENWNKPETIPETSIALPENDAKRKTFSNKEKQLVASQKSRGSKLTYTLISLVLAVLLSLLTGLLVWNLKPIPIDEVQSVIRASIELPQENPLMFIGEAGLGIGRRSLTISRDGKKIIYVGRYGKTTKLFMRNIDDYKIQEVPNTEGAYTPVFSQDGKYASFFQKNNLKKIVLDGGESLKLAEESDLWDATWGTGNEIFFSSSQGNELFKVTEKQELISYDSTGFSYQSIQRISGTPYIIFSGRQAIGIHDVKNRNEKQLTITGTNARYVPTGHIVFLRGSSLVAVAFDITTLEVKSEPAEILSGVRAESEGDGQFDFSLNGTLVFVHGEHASRSSFVFKDLKKGEVESLNFPVQQYEQFSISPDAARIAAPELHNFWDIYIYELNNKKRTRFTNEGSCHRPVWFPDGQRIFYVRDRNSYFNSPNKEEKPTLFMKNAVVQSFSEDGTFLVIRRYANLYVRKMEDSTLHPIASGKASFFGSISPDGRYVAYTSSESGESHVYLQPYPTTSQQWQVSTEGGSEESRWSKDGKKLYYRWGKKWMEVSIEFKPNLQIGIPRVLFEGDYINVPGFSYDVTPEGERFLLLKGSSEKESFQISIIHGWFEELKRLVPVSK